MNCHKNADYFEHVITFPQSPLSELSSYFNKFIDGAFKIQMGENDFDASKDIN